MHVVAQSYCEEQQKPIEFYAINNEFKIPRRQRIWL